MSEDLTCAGAPSLPTQEPAGRPAALAAHLMPAAEVAAAMEVDTGVGLTRDEAARRLAGLGPNRLAEAEARPRWKRFLDQFRNFLVYILLGAAAVSAAVGDLKDPIVILIVLLINAVLGYVQENRADEAMAALASMLELVVKVRRGGEVVEVPAADLVPGDVVLLEAGDKVPADGRFVSTNNVAVEEAALTGESVPSEKQAAALGPGEGQGIGDRSNCGFMNTTVVRGRAELVVTATGMDTQVGQLAGLLAAAEDQQTPLQKQLDTLGHRLAVVAIVAVLAVFVLSLLDGSSVQQAMLESVALAVAAIPEGLPAVVTVTLAIGVSKMAAQNAVVKRLASVETLGSTTAICSDKTGTLTLNQMTATRVARLGARYRVSGLGYGTGGAIETAGTGGAIETAGTGGAIETAGTGGGAAGEVDAGLRSALALGALCNDAVVRVDATGAPEMVGDPTEAALVVLAAKAGIDVDGLRARLERLAEVPFDSATKYMATLHEHPDDPAAAVVVVKGAPDVVLGMCAAVAGPDGPLPLDDEARRLVEAENVGLGGEGLRVLAVASRRLPVRAVEFEGDLGAEVAELTLEALVGILDPARPEAVAAIAECHDAGIGVRMITGDHAATAGAIAAELGIVGEVVTGAQLDAMTDEELAGRIEGIGVCARVSPEHKVRVVRALQANGEVVAMTGDGVNDAPALKQAEIGVAMGITGTEVTKEAGDMVLADDNFATIVAAVERGRAIYENILSFVRFQLTTNVAAIGSFLGALLLGLPAPFNPIQVLFVNIIADGPPAMSLGVDPPRPGAMSRPPRPVDEQILSGERLFRILLSAAIMVVITLGLFWVADDRLAEDVALTMTFTTFVLLQMANALAVRVGSDSVFSRHSLSNKVLWLALAGVIAIQVLVVQVPFLQGVFDTVGLTPSQWGICAAGAVGFLVVDEVRSFGQRAIARRRRPGSTSVPSPA